jgi:hypothetical protein
LPRGCCSTRRCTGTCSSSSRRTRSSSCNSWWVRQLLHGAVGAAVVVHVDLVTLCIVCTWRNALHSCGTPSSVQSTRLPTAGASAWRAKQVAMVTCAVGAPHLKKACPGMVKQCVT